MRREAPSTSDQIIDSRDVIARLEELSEERDDLECFVTEAQDAVNEASEESTAAEESGLDSAQERLNEAQERLNEWDKDNSDELKALQSLNDEAKDYVPDWRYGATLVRHDHFVDYCQELLAETGDIPQDLPSYIVIDWAATAENLKVDYTEVDFDGTTYWVR